jgi:hypothetical protein
MAAGRGEDENVVHEADVEQPQPDLRFKEQSRRAGLWVDAGAMLVLASRLAVSDSLIVPTRSSEETLLAAICRLAHRCNARLRIVAAQGEAAEAENRNIA